MAHQQGGQAANPNINFTPQPGGLTGNGLGGLGAASLLQQLLGQGGGGPGGPGGLGGIGNALGVNSALGLDTEGQFRGFLPMLLNQIGSSPDEKQEFGNPLAKFLQGLF